MRDVRQNMLAPVFGGSLSHLVEEVCNGSQSLLIVFHGSTGDVFCHADLASDLTSAHRAVIVSETPFQPTESYADHQLFAFDPDSQRPVIIVSVVVAHKIVEQPHPANSLPSVVRA